MMNPQPKPKMQRRKRHRMTIAVDIPPKVRAAVKDRDGGHCIICGDPGFPNAHFIPRSQGGLGIEENIFTACPECHHDYDNGGRREELEAVIEGYLRSQYSNWNRSDLIYDKWKEIDPAYRFDNSV